MCLFLLYTLFLPQTYVSVNINPSPRRAIPNLARGGGGELTCAQLLDLVFRACLALPVYLTRPFSSLTLVFYDELPRLRTSSSLATSSAFFKRE